MRTIFLKATLNWYAYLAEGGTMLIDCPGPSSELITEMVSRVKTADGGPAFFAATHDSAKIKLAGGEDIQTTQLLLRRLPGSPDAIPLDVVLPGAKKM